MVNKYKERLKHYTINRKLKATLGVVALIACIIGVILISGILAVANNVKGIYQGPMNNVNDIANVKYGLTDLQRAINRLLAEGSDNMADRYANFEKTVEEDVNLVVSGVDDMDKHFKTEATRAKLSEMQAKINEGEKVRPQVMQLLKSGKIDEAYALNYNTYLPIVNEIKSLANDIETLVYQNGAVYYTQSVRLGNGLTIAGIILVVALLFISTFFTRTITEVLTTPAKQIVEAAEQMYHGDMSAANLITYESEDEFGAMAKTLKGTMLNLHAYVDEISTVLREIASGDLTKDSDEITDFLGDFVSIKESFVYILKNFNITLTNIAKTSEQVDIGAEDLSKASGDLAKGTTDQASAVEELTATVETVAALAKKSADQTQTAYDNVLAVAENAEEERKKMDSLTEEMANIIEISNKIEAITSTIEDIANGVSKAVIPSMIERGHGKIINICSMMSELGRETVSAYAAAKGGLKMLTRNICSEYGQYNIQCNGIGPGYIETPQTAPLRERQADGSRHPFDQFICAKTPANRWLKPEELAGPAVFLASEASDAVNGHILYVDGGILAYIGKQPQ